MMGRRSVGVSDISEPRGRRQTKRSSSGVAMNVQCARALSPAVGRPVKKRKQVTLTLTPDPEEEILASKRIKTEVNDARYVSLDKEKPPEVWNRAPYVLRDSDSS